MAIRTPWWVREKLGEEKRAGSLAETAAKEAGLTERARIAATPKEPVVARPAATPRAEAPYLPERLEEGRLGDIMRASPKELEAIYERMPETERPIETIRGTERAFWSPGTKREYGDLRTAMTGFKQRPMAETAAGRLSAAMSKEAREVKTETFAKHSQAMLGRYLTTNEVGDPVLPPELQQIYDTANVMAIKDQEGAIGFIEKSVAKYEQTQARLSRLNEMSDEELAAYEQSLLGGEAPPPETPETPETPEVAARKTKKTYAGRMEDWTKAEAKEKERLAEYTGIPPAYIKPLGTVKRSFTKPIRRERLGEQVDYTRLFGSQ